MVPARQAVRLTAGWPAEGHRIYDGVHERLSYPSQSTAAVYGGKRHAEKP